MNNLIIGSGPLTLKDISAAAKSIWTEAAAEHIHVELGRDAISRMEASRKLVERCVEDGLVRYGITTGFGKFCDTVISKAENAQLQRNLIISHSCGVGEPLPEAVVRAMMLLRVNALAVGYSGVRVSTVEALLGMLNKGVVPVVPEKGSLGSSGDLAPLSHMVLVLIGEGEAFYKGRRMPGAKALDAAGLKAISLAAKEGLALINGTQCMTAIGSLVCADAANLVALSEIVASLSFQALRGITDAYDPRIHELRGQKGQAGSAAALLKLLENSRLATRQGELRVQDAYALRCIPQVHGASRDAIAYVYDIVSRELGAVTDNPIIFPEDEAIISGGNFHGQPIALAMDFLGIALSELANISERRTERLVNPALSNGLPAFLSTDGGLNSGFMIAQYSAASLVSENKVLAHPASVDSIPSSANQEDHVSMGTIAARKARSIYENVLSVLAIEYLAACQAIDLRKEEGGADALSPAGMAAYTVLRHRVPFLGADRVMYPDINTAAELLRNGSVLKAVESLPGFEDFAKL
ncbi:histidine ammonia-lyase [Spirochaetota bacterium]